MNNFSISLICLWTFILSEAVTETAFKETNNNDLSIFGYKTNTGSGNGSLVNTFNVFVLDAVLVSRGSLLHLPASNAFILSRLTVLILAERVTSVVWKVLYWNSIKLVSSGLKAHTQTDVIRDYFFYMLRLLCDYTLTIYFPTEVC